MDESMENEGNVITREIGNIYLNALALNLSKQEILTIEIEASESVYSEHVKPWLEDELNIAYWTPRRKPEVDSIYTSYISSINSAIDYVKSNLENKLKNKISIRGERYLTINRKSVKILEEAIIKRFRTEGWPCSNRYGNIICRSPNPLNSKYLFTFYRAIEFRVTYIDTPLLILRPLLKIKGPSLKDLLNEFGNKALQEVTGKECVALHRNEGKYRKAMILEVKKADNDMHVVRVIFYDGFEDKVDIKNVRLVGNVLFYKKLLVELFGEEAYRQLEKMQRSYSFSLGPKESSFKLARSFKDEMLNIIKNSGVFPFKLGDVHIDIELDLYRVT